MGFSASSMRKRLSEKKEPQEQQSAVATSNIFTEESQSANDTLNISVAGATTAQTTISIGELKLAGEQETAVTSEEPPVVEVVDGVPEATIVPEVGAIETPQEIEGETLLDYKAPTTEEVAESASQNEVSQDLVIAEVTETPIQSEPSVADTSAFQQLTRSSEVEGLEKNSSYAELVESMVSQQCQMSGVKNLDLTTFGLRAQVLAFPNLSVISYGIHKFLGAPFTEEEENLIIHRLALHVAQSEKDRIVIRAVQEVKDSRGLSFYSLLFNDEIVQRFANMFNYTVHANKHESDVSKLVIVVQKN